MSKQDIEIMQLRAVLAASLKERDALLAQREKEDRDWKSATHSALLDSQASLAQRLAEARVALAKCEQERAEHYQAWCAARDEIDGQSTALETALVRLAALERVAECHRQMVADHHVNCAALAALDALPAEQKPKEVLCQCGHNFIAHQIGGSLLAPGTCAANGCSCLKWKAPRAATAMPAAGKEEP
jgi:hypothetical protein